MRGRSTKPEGRRRRRRRIRQLKDARLYSATQFLSDFLTGRKREREEKETMRKREEILGKKKTR
jgi:hypothetical protein